MDITKPSALIQTVLAFILVCGLMIPAQSFAAGTTTNQALDANSQEILVDENTSDLNNAPDLGEASGNISYKDDPGSEPNSADTAYNSDTEQDNQANALGEDPGITTFADAGPFTIQGGVAGTDYSFSGSILSILTSTPLTISTSASTNNTIQVNAGVHADITLDGVTIENAAAPAINLITNLYDTASGAAATDGSQILNPTSLYLTLKDGSTNKLTTTAPSNNAGIRCGEGSILTIDDELDNRLQGGGTAPIEGEKVTADVTLVNGTVIPAGSLSTMLDSNNPGTLEIIGGGYAPGIGGSPYENGGTMTFNGGVLDVRTYGWNFSGEGGASYSAGIGAAGSADGTATVMTFNGGTINAYGGLHGAGIGAGHSGHDSVVGSQQPNSIQSRGTTRCTGDNPNVAGNIEINGGFIYSQGGWHGGAFGSACWSSNKGKTIKITGGTLVPVAGTGGGGAHTGDYSVFPEIGGSKGYVVITGGSVRCSDPTIRFQGIGTTAWGNEAYLTPGYNVSNSEDPNKVFMVKIDLSSEIKKHQGDGSTTAGNNKIGKWELLVAGEPYAYGSPQQFDEGKLYLWLPKSATKEQVTVNLTYYDDKGEEVAIEPLFRNPGDIDTLKRYVQFELPDDYTESLKKYYDGLPFTAYDIVTNPITTKEKPAKILNQSDAVTYVYQRFDQKDGTAQGPEVNDQGNLPSDEGIMRFTMTSTQFSNEEEDGFKENYWGHRAFGWCEIYPVPSRVSLVEAKWVADQEPGKNEHDARQQIAITAEIMGGYFDDDPDKPVADTCKAPTGSVQIYIDDEPVGDPVPLRFQDEIQQTEARATVVLPKNADAIDNGKGGSYTRFNYTFTPADEDFHVPNEAEDATNSHKITVQYLRGLNYLASANPNEDENVPSDEVRIKPVDPQSTIEADPTNGPESIESNPPIEDPGDTPDPDDPDDPDNPDDPKDPANPSPNPGKLIEGAMTIRYVAPTADNPNPGQVKLSLKTPSSVTPTITTEDGHIIEAQFTTDADGQPVRDENGNYEILIDPQAIGKTKLSIKQPANGAYTSTRWNYDVTVLPDPGIAPAPSATKTATNLTHPNGPNQPGDRIHYEIIATNTASGSIWKQAVAQDTLPQGLALDESTLQLHNKAAGFDGALTKTDATASTLTQGQYRLEQTTDSRTKLVVGIGDVGGDTSATVSFDCIIQPDAIGGDITNLAETQGSRFDPNDIPQGDDEQKTIPDTNPTPTNPAAPLDDPTVIPADSAKDKFEATKQVENTTRPDSDRTHLGDTLHYTITFTNTDEAHTSSYDALISDPLPLGIDPVANSIRLIDPNGVSHTVPTSAWHPDTRMLSVYAGDIAGQQTVTVTFDAQVTPDALTHDITNIAQLTAIYPSQSSSESHDPGTPGPAEVEVVLPDDPTDPSNPDDPTDPDNPSDPSQPSNPTDPDNPDPDKPSHFTVLTSGTEPNPVVPDDPTEQDITVTKQAENLTHTDGTTHVGDIVRYTITTTNTKEHTSLIDTVISDKVPQGLEVLSGSIKLTLANGTQADVLDSVFNTQTHTLTVVAGTLKGKESITLVFDALVTKDALNADIGNIARVYGSLPSQIDLPHTPLTPGSKADAINDSDAAWLSSHLVIASPVSYAPGTDQHGGVLPGEEDNNAKTISKTGDEATLYIMGALAGIAILCAALITSIARRKRTR